MPTNQSSPWGGGKLRACSSGDIPATAPSIGTHSEAVAATKVPFGQTSLELSRKTGQSKPLCCTAAPPAAVSVCQNGDGHQALTQSQVTAVPHGSPSLPQRPTGNQSTQEAPAAEPSSKKDRQIGVPTSLQPSPPGKHLSKSRIQAAAGDSPLGLEPLLSDCQGELFVGRRLSSKLLPEAAVCSSLPSQAGRSTRREPTATRRSHSAKAATRCTQTVHGRTAGPVWNSQLLVRGGPPAVLAAATHSKPPRIASLDLNKRAPESQSPGSISSTCRRTSPLPKGSTPRVLSASASVSATQQQPSTDEAPGPAGASVVSVTSRLSTVHLTRPGQSASSPPSSPLPASPSPTEACQAGDTELPGQECVVQVDGAEEELPDELENACSDDDDSDCSSIDGASSTASMAVLYGVEEPMSLGADDDREEKPALVPSLFPFISPTLYFSTANEKVELLPAEQRRLLKWKVSAVTPNVVKQTVARSHFKVTKKSHDWLGCWGHHMKSPCFKSLGEHQKLNHFPGTFQIGRKDRLWRNLSKMQVRFGKQEFSFFPRTFVLPQDIKLLRKAWEDGGSRQKWIIKPPASARGIGIQVIHKWSQMPRKRPLLVQKYLHKPYLISGNKFDLRIYVYVTSYDPLKVYIFSDGLVRFASCKYSSSMKTLGNKFMHLTNYSVNKKNSEYQTNSDDKACQGHKWALKALWQFLGSKGVNTTLIWEKIKDIVIKTIIASEPYVNSLLKMHLRTPSSCHELFGFDIMLDENLKPWILEVNISPSLHSNTALDVSIKGQMIRDLLNLAGFRIPQKEDVVGPCSSASSSTSSLSGGIRDRTKTDLSADEKVKRAFYLTQRYADQDFLSTVLDVLTPEDVRVLAESEDELTRLGQFERVFPSPASSRYLRFFECPRYLNVLLDQWERKYCSNRAKGIGLLRTLCGKGVHLGTSDPAHMWSKCSYVSRSEAHRQELSSPSRSRVVVSHQRRSHDDDDDGSDREGPSASSPPASPSPGSSVTSSACTSPQPPQSASL